MLKNKDTGCLNKSYWVLKYFIMNWVLTSLQELLGKYISDFMSNMASGGKRTLNKWIAFCIRVISVQTLV